jgi:hypothetical protein
MLKMGKKNEQGSLFEIIVVLSIVFIVAFTGQVLIHYEKQGKTGISGFAGANGVTGLVVGDSVGDVDWDSVKKEYLDIAIKDVEINPPSPLVGEPFDIKVKVVNQGFVATGVPFYVRLEIVPADDSGAPTVLFTPMTKSLEPGEESGVSFKIAMITKEGPLKIIATADSTSKLDDKNTANNQRSTTVIITN